MAIAGLLLLFFLVCLASLLLALDYTSHRIAYDPRALPDAIGSIALFGIVALLFVVARFSFGYFVGFYLYTMVFGFLWLSWFTSLRYDHQTARISAVASAIAFLLPILFISFPVPPRLRPPQFSFERMLNGLMMLSAATIALGSIYNFRLIGLDRIYDFRSALNFPVPVGYLIGIISSSVLPFLFAVFVMQRRWGRTTLTLLMLALFYPIALTKMAFFTPIWLAGLAVLSRLVEARITVILSLLLPLLAGIVLLAVFQDRNHFDVVNFRMVTIPSSALNVYNDFFARHELTYFCQISFLNKLMGCPSREALSVVMERAYGLGFFNASLFATEGIASVGPRFAPFVVFVCGLIVALGNCAAHGLAPRLILLSSAVLPQYFLNVPLTTAMLTHGAGALFLLWYLTPRALFDQGTKSPG